MLIVAASRMATCPHLLQGIEHTHAAIANLVLAALREGLAAATPPVVAAHADGPASSAMLETWSALLTGGALALMPPGASLGQLLRSAGVTAALLTGKQLESLLEVSTPYHTSLQTICTERAGSAWAQRRSSKCCLKCSLYTSATYWCIRVLMYETVELGHSCRMAALRRRQHCRRCCCVRRMLRTMRCLKQSLRWPHTSESV